MRSIPQSPSSASEIWAVSGTSVSPDGRVPIASGASEYRSLQTSVSASSCPRSSVRPCPGRSGLVCQGCHEEADDAQEPVQRGSDHRHPRGAAGWAVGGCTDAGGGDSARDAGKQRLTPGSRGPAATWANQDKGCWQRRACRRVGIEPKILRDRSRRVGDERLRQRLCALAAERRRFGYRRRLSLRQREG